MKKATIVILILIVPILSYCVLTYSFGDNLFTYEITNQLGNDVIEETHNFLVKISGWRSLTAWTAKIDEGILGDILSYNQEVTGDYTRQEVLRLLEWEWNDDNGYLKGFTGFISFQFLVVKWSLTNEQFVPNVSFPVTASNPYLK